jgi:hypothetical protein
MPSRARPPESTSRVVTILASSPGWRYMTPVTSAPRVSRSVLAATWPRVVYASSIGSAVESACPTWKKWSMTVKVENPACSAVRAVSARVGAIMVGSDGVE